MKRTVRLGRKDITVDWTLADAVSSWLNPSSGRRRLADRAFMAMTGGYTGAKKGRRGTSEWQTTSGDADSDLLNDLPLLRERSRDLARNAPIATGALNTKVTNIIGTGLVLQARPDREFLGLTDEQAEAWEAQVEREFALWADSAECDMARTQNFYDLQSLCFRSTLENGDIFVLMPFVERPGSPYALKLQPVEADRVSNPKWAADDIKTAGGVERDANGAPVAYHITRQHPGAIRATGMEWDRVPAFGAKTGRRAVLHLYDKRRPGQTRGVPDLAAVIEPLKQLDRYTEAEIMAAVVSGMFTVFVETEGTSGSNVFAPMEPTTETGAMASDDDVKLAPGAIVDLAQGEKVSTANPGRPNAAFDPFVQAVLRQIGTALELPFEILVKHFTASYSAARAAILEAWRFYMGRRVWMARSFCDPIYEAWMTEAVARGRVVAPGFLNGDPAIRKAYLKCVWVGPGKGQIQEETEATAAILRINAGLSTIDYEAASINGSDFLTNNRQRAKERRMRLEAGLEASFEAKPNAARSDDEQDPPDDDGEGKKDASNALRLALNAQTQAILGAMTPPVVNVTNTFPEGMVKVAPPNVTCKPKVVNHIPAQAAPVVNVTVPEREVNVSPQFIAEFPAPK